uniref:Uncharacterized protein n=1 Tax=Lepeophtheirus salmonis TaxID=72036 RepID=A0A0K2TB86_LEPSM
MTCTRGPHSHPWRPATCSLHGSWPTCTRNGLPEAFKEAGSADSVTSHVVGLAADLLLNLPGIEDPVHRGLGVDKKLIDSRGFVSRASQFEDGVSPYLFDDDYCLLSKQLWWKL